MIHFKCILVLLFFVSCGQENTSVIKSLIQNEDGSWGESNRYLLTQLKVLDAQNQARGSQDYALKERAYLRETKINVASKYEVLFSMFDKENILLHKRVFISQVKQEMSEEIPDWIYLAFCARLYYDYKWYPDVKKSDLTEQMESMALFIEWQYGELDRASTIQDLVALNYAYQHIGALDHKHVLWMNEKFPKLIAGQDAVLMMFCKN